MRREKFSPLIGGGEQCHPRSPPSSSYSPLDTHSGGIGMEDSDFLYREIPTFAP